MMKIGNRGFMLAEVIVVSVVIATVLVTLFTGLNNVSTAYETRNRYYDVDSLYVAIEYNEILKISGISLDDDILINANKISSLPFINNYTSDFIQVFDDFYYNEIGDYVLSYITPYNKDDMLSLKSLNNNLTFSDYLDYLNGHLNFDDNYDYMIIVERREKNNIDDCYYYALKLKY